MNKNDKHLYFVLTKRTERLLELSQKLEIWEHIWIGTTIESEKYAYRLNYLKKVKAKHKWINIEPILSDFTKLDLAWIERVCGGTENGPLAREAKYEWVENLAEQCKEQKVPFAFKFRKGSKIKASLEKPNFHWKPNILREFERKSLEGNLKQTSLF
jgi:protein gp37